MKIEKYFVCFGIIVFCGNYFYSENLPIKKKPILKRNFMGRIEGIQISNDGQYITVIERTSKAIGNKLYCLNNKDKLLWNFMKPDMKLILSRFGDNNRIIMIQAFTKNGLDKTFLLNIKGNLLREIENKFCIEISRDGKYLIYCQPGEDTLGLIDTQGRLLWDKKNIKDIKDSFTEKAKFLPVKNDIVFIAAPDTKVYSISIKGKILWERSLNNDRLSTWAMNTSKDGGRLIFGTYKSINSNIIHEYIQSGKKKMIEGEEWITLLDNKGKILWEKKFNIGYSPVLSETGKYILLYSNSVFGQSFLLYTNDGKQLWKFEQNDKSIKNVRSYITEKDKGVRIIINLISKEQSKIFCFNERKEKLWETTIKGYSEMVMSDDGNYIATGKGSNTLYLFDTK